MSVLDNLRAEIQQLPIIDVHSHLRHEHPQAASPAPVLLYHVLVVQLTGAGMSWETVKRLEDNPAESDFAEWVKYWQLSRATSVARAVWRSAQDLWGITGEPSVEVLTDLWSRGAAQAESPARTGEVFERCHLARSEAARPVKPPEIADSRVHWQMERQVLGMEPARQALKESSRGPAGAEGFEALYAEWLSGQVQEGGSSLGVWITHAPWSEGGPVGLRSALNGLRSSAPLPPEAMNALLCAQVRALLTCSHELGLPMFFGVGVETLEGWHTLTVTDCRPLLNWLMLTLKDFPKARIMLADSNWSTVQSVCLAARQCPNIYATGHWWQSMYETSTLDQIRHRLASVPMNKVLAFFSDAYCAEWVLARRLLLEEPLAQALAEWVEGGKITEEDAVAIARAWMHDNAARLWEK